MAAPAAGLPVAAPMAAPAAAPSTVPSAAEAAALLPAAPPGVTPPTCWSAHARHPASSAWNWSKGFPVPGSTTTLGPAGVTAQPVRSAAASPGTIHLTRIAISASLVSGRGRRHHLSPSTGALRDLGLVALRGVAEVPPRRCRLHVHRSGSRLDGDRWRDHVPRVRCHPHRRAPPARPDEDVGLSVPRLAGEAAPEQDHRGNQASTRDLFHRRSL